MDNGSSSGLICHPGLTGSGAISYFPECCAADYEALQAGESHRWMPVIHGSPEEFPEENIDVVSDVDHLSLRS